MKYLFSITVASHMEDIESIKSLLIDLSTLRTATNNFAENNKLGEGGFGVVYKVGALFLYHIHILCSSFKLFDLITESCFYSSKLVTNL